MIAMGRHRDHLFDDNDLEPLTKPMKMSKYQGFMVIARGFVRGSYVKAEPFRPFRIHMASGRTFDIRHPEMVKAGKTYLVIFTYVSDKPEMVDHWDTVSLPLVENISHLDAPVGQT